MIGKCMIHNSDDKIRDMKKLYKYSKNKNNVLTDDLIITGGHSVLVDQLSDKQMSMTKKILGEVSLIGTKYRLLSMIDSNADIYEKNGLFIVYHIALESEDHNMNHGIYANGMLVESCSRKYIETCMYRD